MSYTLPDFRQYLVLERAPGGLLEVGARRAEELVLVPAGLVEKVASAGEEQLPKTSTRGGSSSGSSHGGRSNGGCSSSEGGEISLDESDVAGAEGTQVGASGLRGLVRIATNSSAGTTLQVRGLAPGTGCAPPARMLGIVGHTKCHYGSAVCR